MLAEIIDGPQPHRGSPRYWHREKPCREKAFLRLYVTVEYNEDRVARTDHGTTLVNRVLSWTNAHSLKEELNHLRGAVPPYRANN
ncbi:hypothetical protein [Streptomyces ginkgonis]|uniref:hypothetical protein n=1 Tax=Streptomyces ginkgonis TaxID=1812259 RepID=UPI002176E4F2|nr:hypothetical protein [Streptomyces ginkgonis]